MTRKNKDAGKDAETFRSFDWPANTCHLPGAPQWIAAEDRVEFKNSNFKGAADSEGW